MIVKLNGTIYQSRKRVFAAEYSRLFLEMVAAHRAIFDDLELGVIAHCVGLIGMGTIMQRTDGSADYRDLKVLIGDAQRPATAYAIAEATDIPRTTVIRKLDILKKRGLVRASPAGGFVMAPGKLQGEPFQSFFDKQAQLIVRMANELFAAEILDGVRD
jgi:hypothetical protein